MSIYYWPTTPWRRYNNNAGKFLDELYYRSTGSDHPGVDINGNDGGNTDLGDRVRVITNGIVEEARWYPTWGNIVLVYHPGPGVWTQYAHLNTMFVKKGQQVTGGQYIGTIGRGAGSIYLAHLHFEVRTKRLPADFWPSATYKTRSQARRFIADNYVDGIKFLTKNYARD